MATPFSVTYVDETDSTQDDARAAFESQPILVVAASQREGRGRGGSVWQSAPSSLAVSLAFSTEWEPELRAPLGLLAGLAAVATFEEELAVGELALKWPNDVVTPRGKVAGLLVESRADLVVAGMGVNFQWVKAPPGAASLLGRPATDDERNRVARVWASSVLERSAAGPEHWGHAQYTKRCVTIGKKIRWEPAGQGVVESVSATGELVVRTEQGVVHLRSADVREVRPV